MAKQANRLLKAKMKEYGETQADLAAEIGISLSRFNAKLNKTDNAEFGLGEVAAIKAHYNLTAEEVDSIFFS